ncbi:hypothetical protein OHV05_35635 (plasmid) [Kitasatospora sp. NBC_00070]|uniref:hypothetical protein n=1 Tax=Kitasatospora sp. NBC_00070 TaxID=2975962 RepID=UPI002F91BA28
MKEQLEVYLEVFRHLLERIKDESDPRALSADARNELNTRFAALVFDDFEDWPDLSPEVAKRALAEWVPQEGGEEGQRQLALWDALLRWYQGSGPDHAEGLDAAYRDLGLLVDLWQQGEAAHPEGILNPGFALGHPEGTRFYRWDARRKQYLYAATANAHEWLTWEDHFAADQLKATTAGSALRGLPNEGTTVPGTEFYAHHNGGYVYNSQPDGTGEGGWQPYMYWQTRSRAFIEKVTMRYLKSPEIPDYLRKDPQQLARLIRDSFVTMTAGEAAPGAHS